MKALSRRRFAGLALAALSARALAACRGPSPTGNAGGRRVVSLSPSVTETLFAIGAGDDVVGVSDYCESPERASCLHTTGNELGGTER